MSTQHISDFRPDTAVPLQSCEACGFPLEEGDHRRCLNQFELAPRDTHEDKERPTMVDAETAQAAACLALAYSEVIKTAQGTPEYDRALGSFILLLFPDCNPTRKVLDEPQATEAASDLGA